MTIQPRLWTLALLFGVVGGASGASGCATTGDIEGVQARITALERQREALVRDQEEDERRADKIHETLEALHQAEFTLRKSGATLGLRIERLEADLPKQRGELEAMVFKVAQVEADLKIIKQELADRLGSTAFFLPADLPKDADGIWDAGKKAVKANDVRQAKAIMDLFESGFPKDHRAPLALWEMAKLYETNGDTEEAIGYYQAIFDRHKDAPVAPQAVMRIAELYVIRGQCPRAKSIYKFISSNFKGTAEADEAKKRYRTVLKDCK